MNRRINLLCFSVLCFGLIVSGCQKAADQQAATDNSSAATDSAKSGSSSESKKASSALVVPAETKIAVVLDQSISTKTASSGQTFGASVQSPIEVDGQVVIPKGARASGLIKDAKAAGHFKGGAVLSLTLTSVEIHGKEYEIRTTSPTEASKGKGKRTAAMVGGGAGGGALIGGLAGGGKGALIGGLIGAGAGTAGAGLTGNRDITLPAESVLTFKLVEPLEIKK